MSDDILYRSNSGRGPEVARIVSVKDGVATMVRWTEKSGHRARQTLFTLPLWFLNGSRACGWKRCEPMVHS